MAVREPGLWRGSLPACGAGLLWEEVEFNLGLILLFSLSVLATYAGVAAITGAFLAGMALSDSAEGRVRDLTHGVTELLVPFFLAGIGLHLDLHVFAPTASASSLQASYCWLP